LEALPKTRVYPASETVKNLVRNARNAIFEKSNGGMSAIDFRQQEID
jgi:hypothetical protein